MNTSYYQVDKTKQTELYFSALKILLIKFLWILLFWNFHTLKQNFSQLPENNASPVFWLRVNSTHLVRNFKFKHNDTKLPWFPEPNWWRIHSPLTQCENVLKYSACYVSMINVNGQMKLWSISCIYPFNNHTRRFENVRCEYCVTCDAHKMRIRPWWRLLDREGNVN